MTMQRKSIRGPLAGTGTHVVVSTIRNHGPLTVEQGIAIHGRFNLYPAKIRHIYSRAVEAGWIECRLGKYHLTAGMRELLARQAINSASVKLDLAKSDLVAPPYHPPFRPLKMVPMPQIRADALPLRDHSPKTGSVGFHPQNRD